MRISYVQRLGLLATLSACGVLLLVARLLHLQIVEHDHYVERASARTTLRRSVPGFRGRILDADTKSLAVDAPAFDLMMRVGEFNGRLHICSRCRWRSYLDFDPGIGRFRLPDVCPRCRAPSADFLHYADERDLRHVARCLRVRLEDLEARIVRQCKEVGRIIERGLDKRGVTGKERAVAAKQLRRDWEHRLRPIERNVSFEVVREVEMHPDRNPFLHVRTSQNRLYPHGRAFVHLMGRLGWPDKKSERGLVGIYGLERRFERELKGQAGTIVVSRRRDLSDGTKPIEFRDAVHGKTIELTISTRVQKTAMDALGGVQGALVVVNARTGAVQALVSSPSYDGADYARLIGEFNRLDAAGRRRSPLMERAFRSQYAPGSIMKPFTALGADAAGQCSIDETILCERFYVRNGVVLRRFLRCHGSHSECNLRRALAVSCNIYFQTLMDRAGSFESFVKTGRWLGFGQPTGIETERATGYGNFPEDPAAWDKHQRLSAATGQGDLQVTPAQIARAYAALATGFLPKLHLVARIGDDRVPVTRAPLGFDERILAEVRAGLHGAVSPGGTAVGFGLHRFGVRCKTGTAMRNLRADERAPLHNAWMAGFAEARKGKPPIAFAIVVLETPLSGPQACGPRLERFFESYYRERRE